MRSPLFSPGRLVQKTRDQRWRLAPTRLRAERHFLARWGEPREAPHGRVLSYHSTGTPEWGVNDVAPRRFVEQVTRATQAGYRFVPAADVAAGRATSRDIAITFDDGLRSILAVVPELEARGIPFTVFVVTEWASQPGERFLSWPELKTLTSRGATIGSHSVSHKNFRGLSGPERLDELQRSRIAITENLGVAVEEFAIPFGRSIDWDAECTRVALESGYTAIFSQSENRRPEGTVPRSFVTKYDAPRLFDAILNGRFDNWEEWY